MVAQRPENAEREQRILNVAADLIVRYGYDKTTMGDIADAVGIGRGVLYLHFHSKDEILDALVAREFPRYGQIFLEHLKEDPQGGTVSGLFRNVLYAINSSRFMAAIAKRDKGVFGGYLRRPGNIFASVQPRSISTEFMKVLQEAGVVRLDIDPAVIAYINDALSLALVGADDAPGWGEAPPFDDLMEAIGLILDRGLAPEGGADSKAGKAAIIQFMESAREQMEQGRR